MESKMKSKITEFFKLDEEGLEDDVSRIIREVSIATQHEKKERLIGALSLIAYNMVDEIKNEKMRTIVIGWLNKLHAERSAEWTQRK